MLILGSDVNNLLWKTLESLRQTKLVFSLIQFCMANQYYVLPIGCLKDVEVDINGVKTYAKFEVIDIIGDKDLYPNMLGFDWAFENYAIIDLKRETMIFEVDGVRVIQPLDPF